MPHFRGRTLRHNIFISRSLSRKSACFAAHSAVWLNGLPIFLHRTLCIQVLVPNQLPVLHLDHQLTKAQNSSRRITLCPISVSPGLDHANSGADKMFVGPCRSAQPDTKVPRRTQFALLDSRLFCQNCLCEVEQRTLELGHGQLFKRCSAT